MRALLAAAIVLVAMPSRAEEKAAEPKTDPDVQAVKAQLKQFLDILVKAAEGKRPQPAEVAKKLAQVRKLIHPKTQELIADQEKRKSVTNGLAVWHFALKDYWLKEYEIVEVRPAPLGALVGEVREKNWRVEEKGEDADPEPASYLFGKVKGKWVLTDKRRNDTFTDSGVKAGYAGFFDEAPKAAKEGEPSGDKPKE